MINFFSCFMFMVIQMAVAATGPAAATRALAVALGRAADPPETAAETLRKECCT